jgi:hypothetical protein
MRTTRILFEWRDSSSIDRLIPSNVGFGPPQKNIFEGLLVLHIYSIRSQLLPFSLTFMSLHNIM